MMELGKLYCLDENYIFPKCFVCKKELSPYSITSTELNKLPLETIGYLVKFELVRLNFVEKNKHLIWICKDCCLLDDERG